MRDNDSLILESLYAGILLKESSDEEYLRLAENPEDNKEALQGMVDEAANAVEYVIKAWHGTRREFNIFDKSRSYTDEGFFFFDSKSEAARWASISNREGKDRIISAYLKIDNPLIIDKRGAEFDYASGLRMERYWAETEGKDGIIVKNVKEGKHGNITTQYNVFDPNQIKLADPVTYDDNDNIIPLSQRFDASNDDIRY
jgi:hypothetical protein